MSAETKSIAYSVIWISHERSLQANFFSAFIAFKNKSKKRWLMRFAKRDFWTQARCQIFEQKTQQKSLHLQLKKKLLNKFFKGRSPSDFRLGSFLLQKTINDLSIGPQRWLTGLSQIFRIFTAYRQPN